MGWAMFYLFVALKIPLLAAIWLVWWAIRQVPDPSEDVRDDGGDEEAPASRPAPARSAPRRGPHGDAAPLSPPRVRSVHARGRELSR